MKYNKEGRKKEYKKNKIEKTRDPYGLQWNYLKLRTHFQNAVHKKDFISFEIFFYTLFNLLVSLKKQLRSV